MRAAVVGLGAFILIACAGASASHFQPHGGFAAQAAVAQYAVYPFDRTEDGRLRRNGREAVATVYFQWDQSTLTPEAQQTLMGLAEQMRGRTEGRLLVVAHKDREGSESYNVGLTERMAATVRDALMAYGVGLPISTEGRGESVSAVFLSDETRDPDWRRADIYLIPGE